MAAKQKVTVHELFIALSQCEDRSAAVTVKQNTIHVGGKALDLDANDDDGNGDGAGE